LEAELETLMRPRLAAAWEAGFYAGQQFGRAYERHDPQWDREDAPTQPANPYRLEPAR
jgi:hypothetical protein